MPRAVFEAAFSRIDDILRQTARAPVWPAWIRISCSTASFDRSLQRLISLLSASPATLTKAMEANPERTDQSWTPSAES